MHEKKLIHSCVFTFWSIYFVVRTIPYIASRVGNCSYARQNSCIGYLYVYLCRCSSTPYIHTYFLTPSVHPS